MIKEMPFQSFPADNKLSLEEKLLKKANVLFVAAIVTVHILYILV